MLYPLTFLLLSVTVHASILTLQSPRFSVLDSTSDQLRAEPISLVHKPTTPVKLDAKDILKINFQVLDKETGNGLQPHQTFLRFYDETTNEEGIQPVRVTSGGKAKFELNMSRPPLSLPPTADAPLKVTLIIGSPQYDPLSVELFDLVLPNSLPAPIHPDEVSFHLRPEIKHTFRSEQKLPPQFISFVFSGIALSPWIVLIGLWSQVSPRVTRLFSPSILPFILTLGAFEGLLFWYWVELKLGQVLLYGAILSLPTFFAGKQALSSISARRLRKK